MLALVITTINVPYVIDDLIQNLIRFNHSDVEFIIVGDRKTPLQAYIYLSELKNRTDFKIHILDIEKQENWLNSCSDFLRFMPYDCVARRNIGYLYASHLGADIIVSMDDDNFPLFNQDFLEGHLVTGRKIECDCVKATSGWFNICDMMNLDPLVKFFHRGFPLSKRRIENNNIIRKDNRIIGVNAGLWLGDPDVDTFTRLALNPCKVTSIKVKERITTDSYTVFNSQNTSFSSKYIPFSFLITFEPGYEILEGDNSFRFDDIWMSIFMQKAIKHLGECVCFGLPIVNQNRNFHNYYIDMKRELMGLEMTDKLIDQLGDLPSFSSSQPSEMYSELITFLESDQKKFNVIEQKQINNMLVGMRLWNSTIRRFL